MDFPDMRPVDSDEEGEVRARRHRTVRRRRPDALCKDLAAGFGRPCGEQRPGSLTGAWKAQTGANPGWNNPRGSLDRSRSQAQLGQ